MYMAMTRRVARETFVYGLGPGVMTAAVLYLLDTLLLGRSLHGLLVLAGLLGGLALVGSGLKSRSERELRQSLEQQENRLDVNTAAKDVTEVSGDPGFWPRSDLARRAMLYGAVVTAGSAVAFAVML
jgi:hypothetical protein